METIINVMYLIVTRTFPPELVGMQNLMWCLAKEISKNFMILLILSFVKGVSESKRGLIKLSTFIDAPASPDLNE